MPDHNTPCQTYSESGQPTGGGPCEEFVRIKQDRDALKAKLEKADALADAVKGIKPTVLFKRKPQDYIHMTDCEKMNAVAIALRNYTGDGDTWPLPGGGE